MIRQLRLAVYVEGNSDESFLPALIKRTAEWVLGQSGNSVTVDVRDPKVIKLSSTPAARDRAILEVARVAHSYHALIVHSDADKRTQSKALKERYQPGYNLVLQAKEQDKLCQHLLPIIPVRMIEAWMLVDYEALREVIGTEVKESDLHLPRKAKQVEALPDPKQIFNEVIRRAVADRSMRQRAKIIKSVNTLFEPLGRTISLERLNEVPAFQVFVRDLSATLTKLGLR